MYFEKQIKGTARADNKNSVSPAKKYPCFKLVFNDNWNDYGYSTWFHLWFLEDSNKDKWCSLGDLKIMHREDDVYAVHLLNLIPTCHECNDDKGEHWLNNHGERMFFNAYFDRLADLSQLLKGEIFIDADTGRPCVKVVFDDVAVAASGEIGRLVTSTYAHVESIRKQWRMKAAATLKNQLRQIKSSLAVRIRKGKYVDGDWSHEKETLVETLADLEPYEFIEKVVYENMLASAELDAWIVEKARNL